VDRGSDVSDVRCSLSTLRLDFCWFSGSLWRAIVTQMTTTFCLPDFFNVADAFLSSFLRPNSASCFVWSQRFWRYLQKYAIDDFAEFSCIDCECLNTFAVNLRMDAVLHFPCYVPEHLHIRLQNSEQTWWDTISQTWWDTISQTWWDTISQCKVMLQKYNVSHVLLISSFHI